MKKFKKYLESPKDRKIRKNREYAMAFLRTVGTFIGALAAIFSLAINTLLFLKVYFH